MKHFLFFLTAITVLLSSRGFAQPAPSSPKPGITIDGGLCLIGNLIYSCTPKTCSSIAISAGDSVEFCTAQQITLNTDTAYYMRWEFNGSSNYPTPVHDAYPNATPLCRYPKWTAPGTYTVDVYYNGWLSAYPGSDCYTFGPSHWIIDVIVTPVSVEEKTQAGSCTISPNPGDGIFRVEIPEASAEKEICVRNLLGQIVFTEKTNDEMIDLRAAPAGVYLLSVKTPNGVYLSKVVKQ